MARTRVEKLPFETSTHAQGTSDKAFQSERISSQIEAFEKSGGRVEKLGVTPYVDKRAAAKRVEPVPAIPGQRQRTP